MNISLIVPCYNNTVLYQTLIEALRALPVHDHYKYTVLVVTGSFVQHRIDQSSVYYIEQVSAGFNAYYTECINFGLDRLRSLGVNSGAIFFSNADVSVEFLKLAELACHLYNNQIDCIRPRIVDRDSQIEDFPKKISCKILFITSQVEEGDGPDFHISGFRLIGFSREFIGVNRLDSSLVQYGSDYEFLYRLRKTKTMPKIHYNRDILFFADLTPASRKISQALTFRSFCQSIFSVTSPLSFQHLRLFFSKVSVPFPMLSVMLMYSKAVFTIFVNFFRRM